MRNIAVLTADEHRHRYFANYLSKRLNVSLVISETKSKRPQDVGTSKSEDNLLTKYFEARRDSETMLFPSGTSFDGEKTGQLIELKSGEINSDYVLKKLDMAGVDTLAVFGTSILKSPIINRFTGSIFNIHLGLSPYYRGSATNFWALYNEDLNMVGATIHYLNEGIDSGPIICHVRTNYREGDSPHDIGNRVIMNAVNKLCDILVHFDDKKDGPPATNQWNPELNHYYERKDFNATVLKDFLHRWNRGLVQEYMSQKHEDQDDIFIDIDLSK